jgi:RNA polymerase sigma-70 factor (ECF subfamily)
LPIQPTYEENAVAARIAKGDRSAFAIICEKYYNRIYGNTLQIVKIKVVAEDIAQEVFLRLWEQREKLAGVDNPQAWIFQIARHLISDRYREQLKEDQYIKFAFELLENQSISTPEDVLIGRQRAELLKRSMETLSPKQREAYRLSREEGKSYMEIAELMGISKETVKEHIHLALHKIRQYLLDHKEELIGLVLLSKIIS